jgi:cytidylate kinase
MAIITISRGSYRKGKEVAEKVARKLGYQFCVREVLLEASEMFNIPEMKLVRALDDAPSIFENFSYSKEKFIAYFQSAFLKRLQPDNVVYHGLAGHFFLKGISHVLKVRIIADMEDRIEVEMEREGISYEDALAVLKKDDSERRKWSQSLYGIDIADPDLYDLVIHVRNIIIDDAVDMICHAAELQSFKTTPESQKAMDDLVLASEVKTALIEIKPDILVFVRDGGVTLCPRTFAIKDPGLIRKLENIVSSIPGVKDISVKASQLV